MAMALRGVRVAGPRIGRSVLATNVSFNEREVQQGEALIDEHFHPRIHPDDNVVSIFYFFFSFSEVLNSHIYFFFLLF